MILVLGWMTSDPNYYRVAMVDVLDPNKDPLPILPVELAMDLSSVAPSWRRTMGLWCMSSVPGFRHMTTKVRSVILASGTLAPLLSFEKELGCRFAHKLEAPHCIDASKQVCLVDWW